MGPNAFGASPSAEDRASSAGDGTHAHQIQKGFEVFLPDGEHAFGAVRQVAPHGRNELTVYVENAGDFLYTFGGHPGRPLAKGNPE